MLDVILFVISLLIFGPSLLEALAVVLGLFLLVILSPLMFFIPGFFAFIIFLFKFFILSLFIVAMLPFAIFFLLALCSIIASL